MSLEEEFTQALEGTIDAARARCYIPTYFMLMLSEYGGVETAKRLLAKSKPQTGLFELWNLGILHESMEAIICHNPRFHSLFELAEIAEAHRRLEELGYSQKGNQMSGKYTPLEHYLRDLPASQREVTLSFEQIERILDDRLPLSATQHRPWWSNETEGSHVQAHAWLDAGWKVDAVNSNGKWVRFRREK